MLISMSFVPVLSAEIRQVRNAMKTRGVISVFNPTVFYRAFFIPLIVRLVNISDTLALSVETRGFVAEGDHYTVYHPVRFQVRDAVFVLLYGILFVVAGFVCGNGGASRMSAIAVKCNSFSYEGMEKPVLQNVCFHVEYGEVTLLSAHPAAASPRFWH